MWILKLQVKGVVLKKERKEKKIEKIYIKKKVDDFRKNKPWGSQPQGKRVQIKRLQELYKIFKELGKSFY